MKEVIKFLADNGVLYSTKAEAVEADYLFHKAEVEKYEQLWCKSVKSNLCECMQRQHVSGTVKNVAVRLVDQCDGMTDVDCTVQLEFSVSIPVKTKDMDHGVNLEKFSYMLATDIMLNFDY